MLRLVSSWIPIKEAWPLIGRFPLLVTDGDLTVRAFTVRTPSRSFTYGIVIPEACQDYFKSCYITHWIYIKNLAYQDYLKYFPTGNHATRAPTYRERL